MIRPGGSFQPRKSPVARYRRTDTPSHYFLLSFIVYRVCAHTHTPVIRTEQSSQLSEKRTHVDAHLHTYVSRHITRTMHSILSKTSYVFHVTRTCQIGVCLRELNQGNRGFGIFHVSAFEVLFSLSVSLSLSSLFSLSVCLSLIFFLSLYFSLFLFLRFSLPHCFSLCLSVCLSVCLLSFLSNVVASEIATTRRRFLVVATFSASRREREERPS